MSSEKFVQIHEGYRVPKEEYEAHMSRMAQDWGAEKRADVSSLLEEDELKNREKNRQK